MTSTPARETLPDRRTMYQIEKEATMPATPPKHSLEADPADCPRCQYDRAQDAAVLECCQTPAVDVAAPETAAGPWNADGEKSAPGIDPYTLRLEALDRALRRHPPFTPSTEILATAAAFETYLRDGAK